MVRLTSRLLCLLLVALVAAPALAGENNAAANAGAAASTAEPASGAALNPMPASGGNVTALLGVLVMKRVLAPAEAKSIESAAPGTEFQALLDALARKGVVSASDLSGVSPSSSEAASSSAMSQPLWQPQRLRQRSRLPHRPQHLQLLRWCRPSHPCGCFRLIRQLKTASRPPSTWAESK